MALSTLRECKEAIKITLATGGTPALIGTRGIGKTSFARQLADELGWYYLNIDANLLKEGEIGGLPVVETVDNSLTTEYAMHNKIATILNWTGSDGRGSQAEDIHILLFIDEINRADIAVQQELMNLILNREINGIYLPPGVHLMCAMNPNGRFSEFSDNDDYVTSDMDSAIEDRLTWFMVTTDIETWAEWAVQYNEYGETNIDIDIVNFLSSNPNLLDVTKTGTGDVTPSPRSWERVSNKWRYIKKYYPVDQQLTLLQQAACGDVGGVPTVTLAEFIRNNDRPIVTAKEIFEDNASEGIPDDIMDRILKDAEGHKDMLRCNLTMSMVIDYLNKKLAKEGSINQIDIDKYMDIQDVLPPEVRQNVFGIISDDEHKQLALYLIRQDENHRYTKVYQETDMMKR